MSETQWIDDAKALLKDGKHGASGANQPSRRDVLKVGIGLGFPAAVQPVAAQTLIQTPSDGLVAGPVRIQVGDFEMPAYRSMPQDGGPHPVILVISEIFGVHEHIADVTRRFARLGYCAIAPDLFVRQGDPQSISDIGRLMSEIIAKVPDEQVMGDLDATVAWAQAQGQDTGRLGITGFCWGGRITWLYAARQPAIRAGVAWYGRLVGQATSLQPRYPVDVVAELKAPVLGLYGAKDQSIPLDSVEAMKKALAMGSPAAKRSEFVVYPEAGHAFHADYRPSYVKSAADDGWQRCQAWFKQWGVA